MKVLILTPSSPPEPTGNAVSSERLLKGLKQREVEANLMKASSVNLSRKAVKFGPDFIHALHALKSGPQAMKLSESLRIPFAVTITGTDLNIDLAQSDKTEVESVLEKAVAIIVYSRFTKKRLLSSHPEFKDKLSVIKPSISMDATPFEGGDSSSGVNFLLPSGIRPVKDPCFAIAPLERLRKEIPSITLTVAGPRLDEEEWDRFQSLIEGKEWINHITVRHNEMPSLYKAADVVLNTSRSEGLSNAVLEGMYFGRAVLASDCEGNKTVISYGNDGFIYRLGDEEDFIPKAKRLATDRELRVELGRKASRKVRREYNVEAEIDGHIGLYTKLLEY